MSSIQQADNVTITYGFRVDRPPWWDTRSVFVADDLVSWLIGRLADAGWKGITDRILGTDQERELRSAATIAVQATAAELRPEGGERAEELARVVSEIFRVPMPGTSLTGHGTLLEGLQAAIAEQLAVLGDPSRTGTGKSSAEVLGVQAKTLADTLFSHLVREIVIRGARGGALTPLASQLNDDVTHLQGQRLEGMVGQLAEVMREALTRLNSGQPAALDAAISGSGEDPHSWLKLIVEQLDERGVAAAKAVAERWQERPRVDPAWLDWVDSLLRLTEEGRLPRAVHRPLPHAGGGTFVGREQQVDELNSFLDRVQHGRGGLALILGPAGMGKSRLLAEVFATRASDARPEWVAFAREEAGYRGWRRLLGPLWVTLRRTELAPAELRAHTETLDDILLPVAGTGLIRRALPGDIAEAIAALLGHVAAGQPLMLVVDDAHRGGASSDQLLLDVAARVNAGPVGIVAALRPDELETGSPIEDYADQPTGRSAQDMVTPIRLPSLGARATAELLRERVGKQPPIEVVDRVLRTTEGQPQLILNTPVEVRGSEGDPSSWITGKLELEGLQVLESTLKSRPAETRTVLEAAAVCAADGPIEPLMVAGVAQLPIDDVESILDRERQRDSILARQAQGYSFRHDNWVDALATSCPPARLRELHARCLELLRRYPNADPQRLAQHAIEAGVTHVNPEELVTLARKAAELAVADYALGTAIKLYEAAVPYAAGKEQVELLIAQSDALRYNGQWDAARTALKNAASQAKAFEMPQLEAKAMVYLQRLTWTFGLEEEELTQQIRDVLDRLPPETDTLRAQLQAALAAGLTVTERKYDDEQATLARKALLELPRVADPAARADILIGVRAGLQDNVSPDELLEFDRQLLELARKTGVAHHMGEALVSRVVDLIRAGRLLEAQSATGAHRDFEERNPAPVVSCVQASLDAMISLARADFAAASEHTSRADQLSQSWAGSAAHETVMAQVGWHLYETGQVEGLAELLEELPRQDMSPLNEPIWSLAAGLIYAEQENAELASNRLRDVCTRTDGLRSLPRGPARIGILAVAAMLLGHPALRDELPADAASRWGHSIADLLAAHHDSAVLAGWPAVLLGSKHRYIGLAYLAVGQAEEAGRHLAEAVAMNREFAALQVRAQFDFARALLQGSHSHSEGIAEMSRVEEKATALGMARLAAQAATAR
jgi:hypothetical protein